jgi:hypothetical protein
MGAAMIIDGREAIECGRHATRASQEASPELGA